jgi:hypothetical protein
VPGVYNPQAWDRYAFVFNNPLRFTDPSGHYGKDVHDYLTLFMVYQVALQVLEYKSSENYFNPLIAEAFATDIASINQGVDYKTSTFPLNISIFGSQEEFQVTADYYHFSSQSDIISRLTEAVQNSDVTAFAMALHAYQDSFSHTESGYSYYPGLVGIWEILRECPTCSSRFSTGELIAKSILWGHFPLSDNYSSTSARDAAMERSTRYWATKFFLEYFGIDAIDYYSAVLGYEVQ